MVDLSVMLEMNPPDKTSFTRREALRETLMVAVAGTLILPLAVEAGPLPAPQPEAEYVPENDYPFFGGELPEGY